MGLSIAQLKKLKADQDAAKKAKEIVEEIDADIKEIEELADEEMIDEIIFEKPKPKKKPVVKKTLVEELGKATGQKPKVKPVGKFDAFKSIIKEVQENSFASAEDGLYTGKIDSLELTTSAKGNQQIKTQMSILTLGGLPRKGKIWNYLQLEHEKEQVVKISFQKLTNMLKSINVVIDDETDLELVFNNLNEYFKDVAVVVEIKDGFSNIKNCNGIKC